MWSYALTFVDKLSTIPEGKNIHQSRFQRFSQWMPIKKTSLKMKYRHTFYLVSFQAPLFSPCSQASSENDGWSIWPARIWTRRVERRSFAIHSGDFRTRSIVLLHCPDPSSARASSGDRQSTKHTYYEGSAGTSRPELLPWSSTTASGDSLSDVEGLYDWDRSDGVVFRLASSGTALSGSIRQNQREHRENSRCLRNPNLWRDRCDGWRRSGACCQSR